MNGKDEDEGHAAVDLSLARYAPCWCGNGDGPARPSQRSHSPTPVGTRIIIHCVLDRPRQHSERWGVGCVSLDAAPKDAGKVMQPPVDGDVLGSARLGFEEEAAP